MINNQLLDYIKQQKLKGVNDKDIKTTLQVQGWQSLDLNEAFNLTTNQLNQVPKSNTDCYKPDSHSSDTDPQ